MHMVAVYLKVTVTEFMCSMSACYTDAPELCKLAWPAAWVVAFPFTAMAPDDIRSC